MKIIIVGLGQAGSELAKELIEEKHDVSVIDIDKNLVEEFTDNHDAIGIVGNGASKNIQMQAKVNSADLLVALSPSDEVNLLSCIIGKKLGVTYTIARINDADYKEDENYLYESLNVDMAINAEFDTADEITRIITYPSSIKSGAFANGKVDMFELKIREDSELCNLKLTELKNKYNSNVIVASIIRNGKIIIPKGNVILQKDDIICVISTNVNIHNFMKKLKLISKPVKSVFIVGCGNIGRILLKKLEKMQLTIKVIEFNKEKCIELMEEFPNVEFVHGNGIDSDMLIEEGLKNYDCCISLTGADETNLVVTLFAWSCNVKKLITKISSLSYTKMLHNEEIDNTLSPHQIVLSSAHRFIRGVNNKNSAMIKSLHRFAQNMAESIEFEVGDDFEKQGTPLKNMEINKDCIVAFIIRDGETIMANGETSIKKGDRVIIIANSECKISKLEDVF